MEIKRIPLKVDTGKQTPQKTGPYGMECYEQSGACVCTGSCDMPYEDGVSERIAESMERIAATIRSDGGIIGHMKAAVTRRQTDLISVTGDSARITPDSSDSLEVVCTFIVFQCQKTYLREKLTELFDTLTAGQASE